MSFQHSEFLFYFKASQKPLISSEPGISSIFIIRTFLPSLRYFFSEYVFNTNCLLLKVIDGPCEKWRMYYLRPKCCQNEAWANFFHGPVMARILDGITQKRVRTCREWNWYFELYRSTTVVNLKKKKKYLFTFTRAQRVLS